MSSPHTSFGSSELKWYNGIPYYVETEYTDKMNIKRQRIVVQERLMDKELLKMLVGSQNPQQKIEPQQGVLF